MPPAALSPSQVYWVEADYLEVAAAAARCGAHFTALLYIEAWQEERHGWLVPLDASSAPSATTLLPGSGGAGSEGGSGGGAAMERVQRLLLDTFRWGACLGSALGLPGVCPGAAWGLPGACLGAYQLMRSCSAPGCRPATCLLHEWQAPLLLPIHH